ncbi:MAG: ArnT family glycosyltransferase [Bacteroidia bacterium]
MARSFQKQLMWSKLSIKDRALLFLILILGFSLRIYLSQDKYLHPWDEKYHALVAKNMANDHLQPVLYRETPLGYDYKAWNANFIWLHKQPLPLWLMSFSMQVFGQNEFAIRIPSIIFSGASILITFFLGYILYNKRTGFIAAFFHSINGLLIELCAGRVATDHYDTLFLVFIEAGIFFALLSSLKRNLLLSVLAGFFCGLALLTKWLPGLIIIPVWLIFSADRKKIRDMFPHFILFALTTIFVFAPWQLYIYSEYYLESRWENYHNTLHFTTVLDGQTGNAFYFLKKIRVNYSEIIYIPLIWALISLFRQKGNDRALMSLLTWVLIPILFFSFSATKMQAYVSFTAPALFILTAAFTDFLLSSYSFTKTRVKLVYILLILSAFILPVRYTIERAKFFEKYDFAPTWASAMKLVKPQTENLNKPLLILNVKHPIELMFYTNCIAYPDSTIEPEKFNKLQQEYYIVKNPAKSL